MVWFHPGDFLRGSPHDFDFFQLVHKQKVLVVTVAYRLNVFGFLSTFDQVAPGNWGLMDQVAALAWVQASIEHFGGNKDNVCLFGQGSGAVAVHLHLTSDYSIGLFHKAIFMSGNAFAPGQVKNPKKDTDTLDKLAINFGCFRKPVEQLLSCLRNVQQDTLLKVGEPLSEWKPVIDRDLSNTTKPFIQDSPKNMLDDKLFQRVPVLTGYTDMEDALLLKKEDSDSSGVSSTEFATMRNELITTEITEDNRTCYDNQQIIYDAVEFFYDTVPKTTNETLLRKQFLDFYTDKVYGASTYTLGQHMGPHANFYCYRFDLKPVSEAVNDGVPAWVGVAHNYDLTFVLGLPYLALPKDYARWESADKRVSDIVMKLWSNFATYSNPSNSGVYIDWEPFRDENPACLIIDRNFEMSTPDTMNYKAFQFWSSFYPKVVALGTQCCHRDDLDRDLATIARPLAILLIVCIYLTL